MSNHRIAIDTTETGASVVDLLSLKANDDITPSKLAGYIESFISLKIGKIRTNLNAVQASGTIAFSSFVDGDTVTLNGITLTGKTTPSGASQWAVGSNDEDCANNLVAKINASALDLIVGCLATSRRATVTISSMVDGDTVTVNNHIFTAKTTADPGIRNQFAVGSTDTLTAANLATSINRSISHLMAGVTATSSSTIVTINYFGTLTVANSAHGTVASKTVVVVCLIPGQLGNLASLAISAHGSVSGALLTGGTEGTENIYSQNDNTY